MLKIVKYPEAVLRQKAEPVLNIDKEMHALIDQMAESMYRDDGAGLAAPQVGISKRLIVLDGGKGFLSLFNPEILEKETTMQSLEEGCLSLPGIRLDVSRSSRIRIRATNDQGKVIEMEAEGLIARILQHEIDHINGILIIDHASSIQRALLRPKLKKLEKAVSCSSSNTL